MNAAQPDWVQQSLARLESLEAQREHLEATGQSDRLLELDEEISSLYEVLESVAEQDGDPAANAAGPAPMAAPAAAMAAPVPGPFDAPTPFSPAPMGPPPGGDPFGAAPQPQQMHAPAAPAGFGGGLESYDDLDDTPRSSKAPLVILGALVLAGVGVGAFLTLGGEKAAPPPAEPAGPAKVISSSEIPEDTQEPKAARGADVDQSLGARFKEGAEEPERRSASSSSSSSRPRSTSRGKSSKNDGREIKFDKSKDPLGGV